MSELLIELLSEEIPARMQEAATRSFHDLVQAGLKEANIAAGESHYYYTPRRMAVHITGVPAQQKSYSEEIKGPRVGLPQAAIDGFLAKNKIPNLDACTVQNIGGADYYMYVKNIEGGQTIDALSAIITRALEQLSWPKSMRWNSHNVRWARPLHNVAALFDGAIVQGSFRLGADYALAFNNTTRGHRFMGDTAPFTFNNFAEYKAGLTARSVILDQAERREKIWRETQEVATKNGFTAKQDEKLLTEIVGLVEWPVPFMGSFSEAFLEIAPEVISTSMREHQRYFSVLDKNGVLTNNFICVANLQPHDGGTTIIHGNEKVLAARLADARFFWEQDCKAKLADYLPRLEGIRFHEKLGSMHQKAERLQKLAGIIAVHTGADAEQAATAALLAKADLVTGMVREFPELQGIMGGHYARKSGLSAEIADAITTHYAPLGPNDTCPAAPAAIAVALADKLDTLVGFFSINEKPTGSKDPFALRRAALGVIRLIVENNIHCDLAALLQSAATQYGLKAVPEGLQSFILDRFRVSLQSDQISSRLLDAVLGSGAQKQQEQQADLLAMRTRLFDIAGFMAGNGGDAFLAAIKRTLNVLGDTKRPENAYTKASYKLPEETALANALNDTAPKLKAHIAARDYTSAMQALLAIEGKVQSFFEQVQVMDADMEIRAARLALLFAVKDMYAEIADYGALFA